MERKNVSITITSTQHDIEESQTTGYYSGFYSFLNGTHIISYAEYDTETPEAPTAKNLLKLTDHTFSLRKTGDITTKMFFENEKSHRDIYQTPFGSFPMTLETKKLQINAFTEKITIFLNYDLQLDDRYISNCTIEMEIIFQKEGV